MKKVYNLRAKTEQNYHQRTYSSHSHNGPKHILLDKSLPWTLLFLDNIEKIKKKLSKVLNTFENIMENGAFALRSKCSIFHNIFEYFIFQRRKKELLWFKRLYSKINKYTVLLFRDKEILASYIKDVESALGKVGAGYNLRIILYL